MEKDSLNPNLYPYRFQMEIKSMKLAPNHLDESESSSNRSSDGRPNKFSGLNSTWRELTKEERLINVFVTRMREQDISIHLYNSQAMKVRCYNIKEALKLDPWSSKDLWRRERNPQVGGHADFVPPKSWTAWPLTPDFVPRAGERTGVNEVDRWAPSRKRIRQDSLELEEILIASALRLATGIFQARAWTSQVTSEESLSITMINNSGEEAANAGENICPKPGREHQRETGEHKFQNRAEEVVIERPEIVPKSGCSMKIPFEYEDKLDILQPHVMTDDEKASAILRPTTRHNLTLLDELLIALHETRKACLHYGSETQSETENEDDGIALLQNDNLNITPSLPGTFSNSEVGSHEKTVKQRAGRGEAENSRIKSTRGRERKFLNPLEGESRSEMLQKIARSQRKQRPLQTSEEIDSKSTSPAKSPLERERKRGNSTHARKIRSKRLGLRDWSEVLGAAALSGFPQSVVARATQRCATLFGEGMAIISLNDNPPFRGCRDQIMQYLPVKSPQGVATSQDISESERGKVERASSTRGLLKHLHPDAKSGEDSTDSEEFKALISKFDKFYCPWRNCMRQKQAFMSKRYLTRHLQNVHKLKGSKLKEVLDSGGDEMVGGVHIDGFLEEIVRRQGWRGSDGEPRQRATTGKYAKKGKLVMKSSHGPLSLSRYDDLG